MEGFKISESRRKLYGRTVRVEGGRTRVCVEVNRKLALVAANQFVAWK